MERICFSKSSHKYLNEMRLFFYFSKDCVNKVPCKLGRSFAYDIYKIIFFIFILWHVCFGQQVDSRRVPFIHDVMLRIPSILFDPYIAILQFKYEIFVQRPWKMALCVTLQVLKILLLLNRTVQSLVHTQSYNDDSRRILNAANRINNTEIIPVTVDTTIQHSVTTRYKEFDFRACAFYALSHLHRMLNTYWTTASNVQKLYETSEFFLLRL